MRISMLAALILLVMALPVAAQPAHTCGIVASVVFNRVDAAGYAPRAAAGSETSFNCIAARDVNFAAQRFPSAWQALNYWFVLYSQELGVTLQPLPAPTG